MSLSSLLRSLISRCTTLSRRRQKRVRNAFQKSRRRLLIESLEGRRVLTAGDPFQSFDGVVAPALPADWFVSHTGAGTPWATTSGPESFGGLNHAFISNPTSQSEGILKSAGYTPTADSPIISFVHRYDTEANFDGGVLEIALPGLPYVDILTAGGSFLAEATTRPSAQLPQPPLSPVDKLGPVTRADTLSPPSNCRRVILAARFACNGDSPRTAASAMWAGESTASTSSVRSNQSNWRH